MDEQKNIICSKCGRDITYSSSDIMIKTKETKVSASAMKRNSVNEDRKNVVKCNYYWNMNEV